MKTNRQIDDRSYKKRIIESAEAEEASRKDWSLYIKDLDIKKSQGWAMKTNRQIDDRSYKKRIIESAEAEEASRKDWSLYFKDVKKSQGLTMKMNRPIDDRSYKKPIIESDEAEETKRKDWSRQSFEVGHYPHINRRQRVVGGQRVHTIYDSSHTHENLDDDMLLCLSNLAICFYNIREDTCFHDVKLIMATESGITNQNRHITFEAFSSTSTGERVAVTFETHIVVSHPNPYPRFEIMFVRIKPESQNSQQDHPSEFDDHKAQIYQHRLHQVIETYTIDSQLDSQYSLALYLSQYALVCYNLHTLSGLVVAKHDIKLLEVVELMKPVAEEPTYHITFKAPLRRAKSTRKKFCTFKAEICMPILFPTTFIQLKSGPKVITGVNGCVKT